VLQLQQVLEQLVELPEEPRARLEAACATWLTTQLSDLDDVVGPALCSPYQLAVGGQVGGEEDWRCHLLKQLSVQELLSVIQAAQPRCPYQTTVVAAISVWADARARQQQQEMQQAEGEEVEEVEGSAASLGMTLAEALQLAGAVRLAGLPRSLLPCLQQLPWWSATVSPGEGHREGGGVPYINNVALRRCVARPGLHVAPHRLPNSSRCTDRAHLQCG
jgi:hypothetical protein